MAILTKLQILAAERPAGYRDLADLVGAVRSCGLTRIPAVDRIASVFEQLILGKLSPKELDAALRLRARRGRRKGMTELEVARLAHGPVCQFIWKRINTARTSRGAQAEAIEAAAEHFHKDSRTIQRQWSKARRFLEDEQAIRRYSERMQPPFELCHSDGGKIVPFRRR